LIEKEAEKQMNLKTHRFDRKNTQDVAALLVIIDIMIACAQHCALYVF